MPCRLPLALARISGSRGVFTTARRVSRLLGASQSTLSVCLSVCLSLLPPPPPPPPGRDTEDGKTEVSSNEKKELSVSNVPSLNPGLDEGAGSRASPTARKYILRPISALPSSPNFS